MLAKFYLYFCSMKYIVVFGSTGRVGLQVVKQALAAGHTVTAFLRNIRHYPILHENLRFFTGDSLDAEAVRKAVMGQDAVISALGIRDFSQKPYTLLSESMSNILTAMKRYEVQRVLAVAGRGILQADANSQLFEQPDFPSQFVEISHEHNRVYAQLKASGCAWTLVCPPYIPEGERTGTYNVSADVAPAGQPQIFTGDVADFLVRELDENHFVGKRVGIAQG